MSIAFPFLILFVALSLSLSHQRLNCLLNAKWKLPRKSKATNRLLSDPTEADFWQADHKVAVAEGGGGTGLDNLRTLCVSYVVALLEFLFLFALIFINQ